MRLTLARLLLLGLLMLVAVYGDGVGHMATIVDTAYESRGLLLLIVVIGVSLIVVLALCALVGMGPEEKERSIDPYARLREERVEHPWNDDPPDDQFLW